MCSPLTAGDLGEYRKMRSRYLRYGRRAFPGERWSRYQALCARVRDAIDCLDGDCQTVARLYWDSALSCVAVSMRVYYSERHVRRLRDRAKEQIITAYA